MAWFRWFRRSRQPAHSFPSLPFVRPRVEQLESRIAPAVTAALGGGILTVLGTPANDNIQISLRNGGTQIAVLSGGAPVGTFANAAVNSIAINTAAGTDFVRIDANVLQPASITGTGSDFFYGGGGVTTLQGGSGPNRLVAGAGATTINGGTGTNQLIGGPGSDAFVGGAGTNVFYNVKTTDTTTGTAAKIVTNQPPPVVVENITTSEVSTLLERAAAATPSDDAIVAVVDRAGNILGVRVEGNVSPVLLANTTQLTFAIDGAVSLARTAAYFSNDQAPLTSRTVEFISQSTITQQEVQSNPDLDDPNNPLAGPGLVAPIGIGGHFPPDIPFTNQVDLYDIENTNRDSLIFDLNGNRDAADTITLPDRFNLDPAHFNATAADLPAPESYGYNAFTAADPAHFAQSRGIATLPGGIPLFKNGQLVGGIGVFFPGTTGYASEENSSLGATYNPNEPDRTLEAEFIAFAAAGGSSAAGASFGALGGAPALPGYDLPNGRIDLNGITLDIYGTGGTRGISNTVAVGQRLGIGKGNANSSAVNPGNPFDPNDPNQVINAGTGAREQAGVQPPSGMIESAFNGDPTPSGQFLTAGDVTKIINQGLAQAAVTRAAIRLPASSPAQFVFAISDLNGNIIGLYRSADATVFSLGVAVAKARNVAYYADPTQLQAIDEVPGVPDGAALTSRTFRYLAEPFFPEGIDGAPPGPFSIFQDKQNDPHTGLQAGPRKPPSSYQSVQGYNAFNPDTNFHQPITAANLGNQNGVVLFPGSVPLYKNGVLVGGLGVSGDGVDQDDVVTALAKMGYEAPVNLQADNYYYQGVRLPYQKFNRNPEGD
jgi:uncharacterized protein GlcG (DUF336 family)